MYLAYVNLMLGVFNMVPGFPLDGGRVLRSIIWKLTGRLDQASRVASFVGQAIGFVLTFWGVARVLGGDFLGGVWTALIGWFLNGAAEATRREQSTLDAARGIRVSQVMDPRPPVVTRGLSVYDFVFLYVLGQGRRAALVADADGVAGIVSITDAKRLSEADWSTAPVASIMTRAPLHTETCNADLADALRVLAEHDVNQLPVVDGRMVVGMVSRADVVRVVQLHHEPRGRPGTTRLGRAAA